jgi:TolB-like protein/class 3 adenylate cyclase
MAEGRVERRLAAILAADVAGYSRLMGLDEVGTARTLREHRAVTDALVAKHGGRIVKTTGDGVLLEFPSVVDAVECAVAVQAVMTERNKGVPEDRRMLFRIGINLGDILIEGDDILGDGVNIVARLEGIAEPGGICISSSAYDQVRGKVAVEFADLGEQTLKNIARPVRAYAVNSKVPHTSVVKTAQPEDREVQKPLPLPDKPSIAVLPFQNMSGDPEQEYFADGMVEEIITALSRFKALFVIARNSSFTYKGKAVDIKQVGCELGVRYVLEGSVRKAGARLRITGQLIDAATGAHLWADKFEGELQHVFDLQDSVATSVAGAIAPRMIQADVERARRRPPDSWDSYDFYLRGIALFFQPETIDQALELFRKAIELNPEFGLAHIRAMSCLFMRPRQGGRPLTYQERSEAVQLASRALVLAGDDEFVLAWASLVFAYENDEIERGSELADRALAINPNLSSGWNARGWISATLGDAARALEAFDRAIRLNPADNWTVSVSMRGKCAALFVLDRHSEALEMVKRLLARHPRDLNGLFSQWVLDPDPVVAGAAAGQIRALYPQLRSSILRNMFLAPTLSSKHRAIVEDAIVRLHLPE